MNSFKFLLDGEPAWFVTLLALSLQAAILAAVVFVVIKLVGRWIPPAWRAMLWFLVMVRVLVPFSPPSSLSLHNLYAGPPVGEEVMAPKEFVVRQVPVSENLQYVSELVFEATPIEKAPAAAPPRRVLSWIWALGVSLCLGSLAIRYLVIRRHLAVRRSEPRAFVTEGLAECREKLRTKYPVRMAVSDRIAAPALTGLFPARLIVPGNFEEQNLTAQQVRHVLMHELAHLSQGHLILHWLSLIARALHWFNPALHFAAARLREECELAADAAALKGAAEEERRAYGETILKVLSQTIAPSSRLALGMAEQARHLEKRLRAVASPPQRSFVFLGIVAFASLILSGLSGAERDIPSPVNKLSREKINAAERSGSISTEERISSRNALGSFSFSATNGSSTAKALQDARFLIELGRWKEAENILTNAAKDDPTNRQTFEYLNLIKEQLYAQESRKRETATQDQREGTIQDKMTEIDRAWNGPPNSGFGGFGPTLGNPFAKTNVAHSSTPRRILMHKLETIRIDDFPLENEKELIEVLKELGSEIKKRDPGGKGVNLLIASAASPPVHNVSGGAIDPLTGLPTPKTATPEIDVERFKIKFEPPIRDLTLKQFLDALVTVAKAPPGAPPSTTLKYSVEDYAIVFSQRTANEPEFFTRTYKIDPNSFALALRSVTFNGYPWTAANSSLTNANLQNTIREFFSDAAGVDFSTNKSGGEAGNGQTAPATRAIFYNDRAGILFVRAPVEELDIIEQAIHALNVQPAQVVFQVRIFDLNPGVVVDALKELAGGREIVTTNETLFPVALTEPGVEPALLWAREAKKALGVPVTSTLNKIPSTEFSVSEAKAKKVIDGLVGTPNIGGMTLPSVTTVVGRQARVSVEETNPIVTDRTVVKDNVIVSGASQVSLGPSTDIIAELVTEDGVRCNVSFNFTEFLGYAENIESPRPRLRVRTTTSLMQIPHGHVQIIVVPGQAGNNVEADKKSHVLILTPTVIDSRGMPVFK